MADLRIYPARPALLGAFAARMRVEDRRDAEILFDDRSTDDLVARITSTLAYCTDSWAVFLDGQPLCVGGVVGQPVADGGSTIWQLGTDLVERRPLIYTKFTRRIVASAVQAYGLVRNIVRDDNVQTRRWLAALGFTFEEWPRELQGHMWWGFAKARPCAGTLAASQIH